VVGRRTSTLITVLLLAVLAVFLGWLWRTSTQGWARKTAETVGVIEQVTLKPGSGRANDQLGVEYAYTVNGQPLRYRSWKDDSARDLYAEGAAVKVCYDPAKPQDSAIPEPGQACGR
jgi:hypothetical protein